MAERKADRGKRRGRGNGCSRKDTEALWTGKGERGRGGSSERGGISERGRGGSKVELAEEAADADEEEAANAENKDEEEAANADENQRKTRHIAKGGKEGYMNAIIERARSEGSNFVKFDDCREPKKAKVDIKAIGKLHGYLKDVHDYQENLSVPRKDIELTMGDIFDEMCKKWKVETKHRECYIECLSRRAMNVHRIVQQGIEAAMKTKTRNTDHDWVWELPWMKEEADRRKAMDAKEAETLAPGTPPQGESYRTEPRILDASPMAKTESRVGYIGFELGFDTELKKAWRQKYIVGKKRKWPKELAIHHYRPDGADDEDPIVASFDDEAEYEITKVTCRQYEEMQELQREGSSSNVAKKIYFDKLHKATNNRVRVERREDRYLLMSMYLQNVQICQIGVFAFTEEGIGHEDGIKIVSIV